MKPREVGAVPEVTQLHEWWSWDLNPVGHFLHVGALWDGSMWTGGGLVERTRF